MSREKVEATPRGAMTPARRKVIYDRQDGMCDCGCGNPLRKGWVADHWLQLWLRGSDDFDNLHGWNVECDKPKTAEDARIRAKVKRIIRKHSPTDPDVPVKGRRIASRPFEKGKRKIPSRPLRR